ncbi:MAG: hypothetical protein IT204_02345 [Fimbriimonadaceae bacterium]|nr:hypothetical protein [Fimbriimonadaceae bacterium]
MKRAEREVVDRLVREAVAAHQGEPPILRADWSPFTDQDGMEAVEVALVIPEPSDDASFQWLNDFGLGLIRAFREEELDRFAYVAVVGADEAPEGIAVSGWLHGERAPVP